MGGTGHGLLGHSGADHRRVSVMKATYHTQYIMLVLATKRVFADVHITRRLPVSSRPLAVKFGGSVSGDGCP